VSVQRAVIYVRVSTEDQAENGTSLETQELACLRRASELGRAVHAILRDEGVSGALYEARGGVQSALRAVEEGKADVLIVHSISRLSRDVEHQQAISKRVARAGARLEVCDLPSSDTEEGDLMFGITGAFAQYERKLIRKRTLAGSRRVAEKGRQPSRGQRPFGYDIVTSADVLRGTRPKGDEGTYVIREDEAQLVRMIFERYTNGGSLRGTAERLNADGVLTPRGREIWQPRTIEYILTNPVYRGAATYGLRVSEHDERRRTERGLKTTQVQRRRVEGALAEIPAPPIVDASLWEAANVKLASAKRILGGNPDRVYLLSRIARCPECGRGLRGQSTTGHRYYICNRTERSAHPKKAYPARELEMLVTEALAQAAEATVWLVAAAEAYRLEACGTPPRVDADVLRRDLSALDAREQATARAQVEALIGGRDGAVYDKLLAEIGLQRKVLSDQLSATDVAMTATPETIDPFSANEALRALRRVMVSGHLTVAERREALSSFVRDLRPTDDGVVLQLATAPTGTPNKVCASE
jgi:DNA invertase Pin-like site-specific DNA recombinase